MVTKELIDFVRGEFAKGTPKSDLMTLLMTQSWTALDIQEAFNSATETIPSTTQNTVPHTPVTQISPVMTMPQSFTTNTPTQKRGAGSLVIGIVMVLIVFIVLGLAYLWYGTDIIKNMGKTAQVETEQSGILFNDITVVEGTQIEDQTELVNATSSEVISDVKDTSIIPDIGFDKTAVIAGVLKSQTTLRSQNADKIRLYMITKAATAAQKKQITDTSDNDLLFGASLIVALQPEVTEVILISPDTVFTMKSNDVVEISFYPKGSTTKVTILATKINGDWY